MKHTCPDFAQAEAAWPKSKFPQSTIYRKVDKYRRNMNSLHRTIFKVAKTFPKRAAVDPIANLPNVMQAIIEKKGARTKY